MNNVQKPSVINVGDFVLKPIPVTPECARQIFDAFRSDPDSFKFWREDGVYNSADDVLRHYQTKYIDEARWKYAMYGIFLGDELLGEIGLSCIDTKQQTAEIGYWLKPSARGRGIIKTLIPVIEKLAFETYSVRKVDIWCDADNVASRRNAENNGYVLEGVIRERKIWPDGTIHSTAAYGKLKSEWENQGVE